MFDWYKGLPSLDSATIITDTDIKSTESAESIDSTSSVRNRISFYSLPPSIYRPQKKNPLLDSVLDTVP